MDIDQKERFGAIMAASGKLLGARLKLKRANKHIADLERAIRDFKKKRVCVLGTKRDPQQSNFNTVYVKSVRKVPNDIAMIAGDALFNLRSALDHVVTQLWLSAGNTGSGRHLMFPILATAAKYSPKSAGKVQGLRPAAIKAIEAIQPYKGGRGHQLWVLNELNNIDKHRLLLTVAIGHRPLGIGDIVRAMAPRSVRSQFTSLGNLYFSPSGPTSIPPYVLHRLNKGDQLFGFPRKAKLYKKVNLSTEVAFDEPQVGEGDTAVKTLCDLSQFVADIIDQLGRLL